MQGKVLISGGTGLVGTALSAYFRKQGRSVAILSRRPDASKGIYRWDVAQKFIDPEALDGATAIVHLAGENVGSKRWTKSRKASILESRARSADLLVDALKTREHRVKTFVSASAVGYYGNCADEWVSEDAPPGNDFLAQVCQKWEQSVKPVENLGIRLVKLRIGVVLSAEGGALEPLSQAVKMYVGSPLGSGKQYFPWIHINDLSALIAFCMAQERVSGVFNAVAPNPLTNKAVVQMLASKLNRPVFPLAVPAVALRLLMGEMAEMVLFGAKASAQKIIDQGFSFRFKTLAEALDDLILKT